MPSKYLFAALFYHLLVAVVQAAPQGRIVNGLAAKEGQFPYQVLLTILPGYRCGGSIISQNYILTAGHCFLKGKGTFEILPASAVTVHAGTTDAQNGGVKIQASEIIVHPNYFDNGTYKTLHDIALVRLAKSLKFSKTIKPIELSKNSPVSGTFVTVSGWGRSADDGVSQNKLQWTVLESVAKKQCESAIGYDIELLLCLAHPKNKGACSGDSGGPVVADGQLVGVVKSTIGKCGSDLPDFFIDVSKYYDWIKAKSDA